MSSEPESPELRQARRYVRKLRGFYALLLTAVAVSALAGAVNAVTTPGRWWVLWVVFGFAVALVFSALDVFGRRLWLGADWERRQIDRQLARQRQGRG